MSDTLVDELVSFDHNAPGVAPGWVYAQCEVCDAYTAGPEESVQRWAEAHVESRHRHGRHTNLISPHEALVLDPGDRGGRHRAIRQHAYVQHRGRDCWGCGLKEDGDRCRFYRRYHPTMAGAL